MPRRKKQQGGYIREYYEKITSGEIIAGEWIILLYTIIIAGIDSGRWLYDDSKAQRAINFIESFCHHNKGRSDLIKLELWQKALVSTIFGIIDKDSGYRQFREVFILIARKNGKSILAAAIMAYSAFVDGEYGGELYCLAPKLDQAEIVYNDFYQIVQADDELNELTKKRRSDIYIESLNTTIKKLAFNAKKADGFNPSCTINDEMEAWPGPQGLKQYEVMKSGTGTRTALYCTGSKHRVVRTQDYGERLLCCYETPSPMFGDVGAAQTDETGKCLIFIDEKFAQTIDLEYLYDVFLTKYGPGDCYVSERTPSYFVVKGTKNLKFAWEVKTIQRDYENLRLEAHTREKDDTDYIYDVSAYMNTLLYQLD